MSFEMTSSIPEITSTNTIEGTMKLFSINLTTFGLAETRISMLCYTGAVRIRFSQIFIKNRVQLKWKLTCKNGFSTSLKIASLPLIDCQLFDNNQVYSNTNLRSCKQKSYDLKRIQFKILSIDGELVNWYLLRILVPTDSICLSQQKSIQVP